MRRISLYVTVTMIFLFFSLNVLTAQDLPVPYLYSTNSAPTSETFFNFDITDSLFIDPGIDHRLIFRDQSENTWDYVQADLLFSACSSFTYQTMLTYQPPSNILEWYFRSEIDTAVVSGSPKNESNVFPVPDYLLADLGADAIGDADGGGNNHDIVHFYGSYSDDKLFFRLDNNGGGFPTSGSLFTYYIYSIGLINPNATDSTAFVLLYANVPLLFSPGLYALDLTDSSFTNIGSISTHISGNSLYLSCNISDLLAQPGWPSWPPEAGFIGAAPVTATANFTDLSTNDFGKSAIMIPSSNLTDYSLINNASVLSDQQVLHIEDGNIAAQITYSDEDNNLAVLRNLYFEGSNLPMTACEKDYQTGAIYSADLTVTESGWYDYYYEFSDGAEIITTAVDSVYVDLFTYFCGDANADLTVNVSDAVYIINYVFVGGDEPQPYESADANCDATVNVSDAVYIINYVFVGGFAPCDPDGDSQPDC